MKKLIYLIIILTFIVSACSSEQPKKLTLDEKIAHMQQSVKDTASLSSHTENTATVIYNKYTTQFTEKEIAKTDTLKTFSLQVDAQSNNTKYPVKDYRALIDDGNFNIKPAPVYLNYRAKKADRNYLETKIADHFNLTHIIQNVIKPVQQSIEDDGKTLSYTGKHKVMKALFEYGLNNSSLDQLETFSDMSDIKIADGSYSLTYSPRHYDPKTLTFDITATATIDDKPARIHIKETTSFYDFNKTDVHQQND